MISIRPAEAEDAQNIGADFPLKLINMLPCVKIMGMSGLPARGGS
jgi:hypothetical protein